MDTHSKETRSYNMSRIRSTNSKPEMIVRRFLHAQGFRYILHNKKLPWKPDITLPKYNTVIFINGCFWHCHEWCKYSNMPKSNTDYRLNKLRRNTLNDTKHHEELKLLWWNIIDIRECELKKDKRETTLLNVKDCITWS